MSKTSKTLKEGLLVLVGSFLGMVIAFSIYFMIFRLFENLLMSEPSYGFVPWVRVGYGLIWILVCLVAYRTRIPEWIKASILATSLTTFLAAVGVQMFERPLLAGLLLSLVPLIAIFLLRRLDKQWFHYLAIAIAVSSALFYL